MKLKKLLTEEVDMDLFQSLLDPTTQITDKHKQKFLELVKEYNGLSSSIYRNISLKEITKKILY